jgi:hypothetical protein
MQASPIIPNEPMGKPKRIANQPLVAGVVLIE